MALETLKDGIVYQNVIENYISYPLRSWCHILIICTDRYIAPPIISLVANTLK